MALATAGSSSTPEIPTIDTLVTAVWLSEHLDDPDLVVLERTVRVEMDQGEGSQILSGRADYDGGVWLVDAMPAPHYRGEMALYDRPGHIPGASNIPVSSLLAESGRYRPHDELPAMHDRDRDARVITYCGGGISASSNAFVMTRLGFTDVAVYAASLQEWAADPGNPMVVDTP